MDNHTNPESAGQEFATIGAIGGDLLGFNGPLLMTSDLTGRT
jgi:hypothetical protein